MSRPTESLEWATQNIAEYILDEDTNESSLVLNKVEPSTDFKLSGIRAKAKVVRPYINYILNALCKYVMYVLEGDPGDFRLVAVSTTKAEVEARYGGVWEDRGTQAMGTATARVFEKVS